MPIPLPLLRGGMPRRELPKVGLPRAYPAGFCNWLGVVIDRESRESSFNLGPDLCRNVAEFYYFVNSYLFVRHFIQAFIQNKIFLS